MASSSCHSWEFDVFPSFRREDVRKKFLSHFLEELDRRSIVAFKDNEIERSHSLNPEFNKAIRSSKIAVVVLSENHASSSWCLNELLEILKCQKELGQLVVPVFYDLDPSDVRHQTGEFGKVFEKTCLNKPEGKTQPWRQALTYVAKLAGYHSDNWPSESKMVKEIASYVLGKLHLTSSEDFENFAGIGEHIAELSELLNFKSEQVRMVGIWGTSGIGKTTIARALFSRYSCLFQASIFIDRAFVSNNKKIYDSGKANDYNIKLHMQGNFLSKILGERNIKMDHLHVVGERLKHTSCLLVADDLDDRVMLESLLGRGWFGPGSRIIVTTNDKHRLISCGIDNMYKIRLPSKEMALKMFCRSAFRKYSPPEYMMELTSEVVLRAGNLPLGLHVLGSYLRGKEKKEWLDMLRRKNGLDGTIEKTLRVCYDGLNNKKDEALFCHIACLSSGERVDDIKLLLADSELDVNNIAFKRLVDKSLIYIREGKVEMNHLLQQMGKEMVRAQYSEPGELKFLIQFHMSDDESEFKLRGCGTRLYEDDESSDNNDLGNETDNSEEYEDCDDSDLVSYTEHSIEYECSRRMQVI